MSASQHRLDIQGLRAVAVVIVVAYHAGLPFISGGFVGVDLFFVLSGYLIIGLLVAELTRTNTVNLTEFWARRARRILPASALVIVATVWFASYLSPSEGKNVGEDGMWATLFSANWRFAQQQTDYLTQDRDPSPLLHYWSLGVEEQFYVLVPLVFIAVAWFVKRRSGTVTEVSARRVLAVVLTVVIVASLAYCVHETTTNQPYAYFGTPARAWQLAAGGLLAVAQPWLPELTRRAGTAIAASGAALLAVSMVGLSEGGQTLGQVYPSWLAVGPTLAGILLVYGGTGGGVIAEALSCRPLTAIGDISYSLYLWHWPALVLGAQYFKSDSLGVRLACVCVAVVLSVITYTVIENPVRQWTVLRRRFAPKVSVVAGLALVIAILPVSHQAAAYSPPKLPGVQEFKPALTDAETDEGPMRELDCQAPAQMTAPLPAETCTFGDKKGDKTAVVIGDSTASAILPAVSTAGERDGWKVIGWTKSSCNLGDFATRREDREQAYFECGQWRDDVLDRVAAMKPDLVVMSNSAGSTRLYTEGRDVSDSEKVDIVVSGYQRSVKRLTDADIPVVMASAPYRAPHEIPGCLIDNGSPKACDYPPGKDDRYFKAISAAIPDLEAINTSQKMCDDKTCRAVDDSMITLRDRIHYTQTYARSLADLFAPAMKDASR